MNKSPAPTEGELLHLRAAAQWSYVLPLLAARVHEAEVAAYRASEDTHKSGRYGPGDAQPFHLMSVEASFFLIAADHLRIAVAGSGGRLPSMHHDWLRLLRNAREHWNEPGWSAAALADAGFPDPSAHQWGTAGTTLGGALLVDELLPWADEVYELAKGL